MKDLDAEVQEIQKEKLGVEARSIKTISDVQDVRRDVELLHSAIQTGNQDEYDNRLGEVMKIINRMSIDDSRRKILYVIFLVDKHLAD